MNLRRLYMKNNIEIRIVEYAELRPLFQLRGESVDIKENAKTTYLGAFINGRIVGVVGWMMFGKVLRYKTDGVLPQYRGMGIYSELWSKREQLCRGLAESTTAFCTEKSLCKYLASGFEIVRTGRISFVKRNNNE